ncbi:adenosylhomocysteinase-like [Carya illinoinensis]|uniref:adenosylhomocysteinase-like n=1 Tax=Carya illinoinensis TaxID=32201 RepID=UPI001C729A95|nr:adenosylhomocysteinase-like [Carya illinoinensis]
MNKDIIMVRHMKMMKNNAIVCNIGHFDNEIDMHGLETYPAHEFGFCNWASQLCYVLHFHKPVITQLKLWNKRGTGKYEKKVYVPPKHLDEKVTALHLGKLGSKLTKLTPAQAANINVSVEGPYKPPLLGAILT